MGRNLAVTIVLFAVVVAGCGGGGRRFSWECAAVVPARRRLHQPPSRNSAELYRDDAKLSRIEEAGDEWDDAREDLYYNAEASDFTSGRALEGLYDEGNGLVEASRGDDDEYYEDARGDFDDAKELIHRICAS